MAAAKLGALGKDRRAAETATDAARQPTSFQAAEPASSRAAAVARLEVRAAADHPPRRCLRPGLRGHVLGEAPGPAAATGHRTIGVRARVIDMRFTEYSFGSVQVDGVTYDHDLIVDRGEIRKRKKAASRKFRDAYGHTPLSTAEDIPWNCRRLVIGTGADGALPVTEQVRQEADRRKVDLVVLPTVAAIGVLTETVTDTNAVLHLTC
jgi:hypothetical protein